ncbi:MAG: class I SAM-dependent methyltransferase, partial [Chloroflexota bacterium]
GRVTQQIARAGISVVGIDNSETMLALCRAKLARNADVAARATLLHGDMTNFDLTAHRGYKPLLRDDLTTRLLDYSTIGLVIAPFNTFMHLLTTAEQLALLTCARKHLQTGGVLALDLTNPVPAYVDTNESLTLERTFRDDENDLTIQQFSTIRIDRALQIAHIVWQYDAIAVDGTVKRALVPLDLRYTFPAEMGLLLERTGFRLAHLYGDYDETPLTDESERMIVVGEAV